MKKSGTIDSLNLSFQNFEYLFTHRRFKIITVKSKYTEEFYPNFWKDTFGKSLTPNIVEAKIICTTDGLYIPLKRFSKTQQMQTIEFAGLKSYNDHSRRLESLLIELSPKLQDCFVRRIDVAFDYQRIPKKVIEKLQSRRGKKLPFKNTEYYKTLKELKTNQTLDIKIYNKSLKEKLDFPLFRLEFCNKGSFFNNARLSDFDAIAKNIEKRIFSFSGIDSKISSLSYIKKN